MLTGQTVIVTGAAQGIGKAVAQKMALNHARVVLCDINDEILQKTVREINDSGGVSEGFKTDVSSMVSVQEITNKVLDKYGSIDILINNAGITRDNLVLRMTEEEWDSVISVNLKGTFNFCHAVAKPMIKKKMGKIINIASIIGLIGNAGQVNYAASKAGVIALTKSLAKELAGRGIRVNAIAPGFIQTAMTDKLSDEIKQQMLQFIPLKSFGKPDDVANTVLYLASDLSSYITGQVVVVDGGMVM